MFNSAKEIVKTVFLRILKLMFLVEVLKVSDDGMTEFVLDFFQRLLSTTTTFRKWAYFRLQVTG
jgi:hypothetical protein